jgi:hypothetical protein
MGTKRRSGMLIGLVMCMLTGGTLVAGAGAGAASPVQPIDDAPVVSPVACAAVEATSLAAKAEPSCRPITFGITVKNDKWEVIVRDNIGDVGVADGATVDPNVPGKAKYTLTVVLTDPDPTKMTCVFDGIYVPGGSGIGTPEVTWTLKDGKYQLTIKVDGKLIDPGQGGKQEGYRIFVRCKPNK